MRSWFLGPWVCVVLFAPLVQAQIYTWTDSDGRIHYSDQPTDKNAVLQSVDIGTMPAPTLVASEKPALFKTSLYPLIVSQFEYSEAIVNSSKVAARFYFGGDCVSPTTMRFDELRLQLPGVIREPEQLQVDVFRAIRRLGHSSLYRAGHYGGPAVDSATVRYLSGEIIALDIAACRDDGASNRGSAELNETMIRNFKIANTWLKVRWQLRDQPGGMPLLSIVTEGSAATQINTDVQLYSAVRESFSAATANVLDDDRLRQALTKTDAPSASIDTPAPSAEPSNTNPFEAQVLQRANLAGALTELAVVKIMVAEYYQVRGVMPLSMAAVGVGPDKVQHSRYLSRLHMQIPGVIHAELNTEKFPAGQFVELIPEISQGFTLIEWRCETNLQVSASACQSLATTP